MGCAWKDWRYLNLTRSSGLISNDIWRSIRVDWLIDQYSSATSCQIWPIFYSLQVPFWLTYDFPPEVKAKLNKQWGTNWNGQAQKWWSSVDPDYHGQLWLVDRYYWLPDYRRFLFRLTGGEEEIDLAGDGSEKPEFGEWSWLTPDEVIDRVSQPCKLFNLILN